MHIVYPTSDARSIRDLITQYGYTPDHQYDWFLACAKDGQPCALLTKDGGVLAYEYIQDRSWVFFSDPLAPQNRRGVIAKEAVHHLFEQKNVLGLTFLDVRSDIHEDVMREFGFVYERDYTLTWPVLDMRQYDATLPGGAYKELRNARNAFYRQHKVAIVPARDVLARHLHDIVDTWAHHRMAAGVQDIDSNRYHYMIDHGFQGCTTARSILINGHPVGFNAGWEILNTDSMFAAAVGVHDYSIKEVGAILFLEDLEWIQKAGYRWCDIGGSEEGTALAFKMQFCSPAFTYTTHTATMRQK